MKSKQSACASLYESWKSKLPKEMSVKMDMSTPITPYIFITTLSNLPLLKENVPWEKVYFEMIAAWTDTSYDIVNTVGIRVNEMMNEVMNESIQGRPRLLEIVEKESKSLEQSTTFAGQESSNWGQSATWGQPSPLAQAQAASSPWAQASLGPTTPRSEAGGDDGHLLEVSDDRSDHALDQCSICFHTQSHEVDPVLACRECQVSVHCSCYGITLEEREGWKCKRCILKAPRSSTTCVLCGRIGGAMKQFKNNTQWAHLLCVWWDASTSVEDPVRMEPLIYTSVSPQNELGAVKTCVLCKREGGVTITCCFEQCHRPVHAVCAREFGHLNLSADTGIVLQEVYCDRHAQCRIHLLDLFESILNVPLLYEAISQRQWLKVQEIFYRLECATHYDHLDALSMDIISALKKGANSILKSSAYRASSIATSPTSGKDNLLHVVLVALRLYLDRLPQLHRVYANCTLKRTDLLPHDISELMDTIEAVPALFEGKCSVCQKVFTNEDHRFYCEGKLVGSAGVRIFHVQHSTCMRFSKENDLKDNAPSAPVVKTRHKKKKKILSIASTKSTKSNITFQEHRPYCGVCSCNTIVSSHSTVRIIDIPSKKKVSKAETKQRKKQGDKGMSISMPTQTSVILPRSMRLPDVHDIDLDATEEWIALLDQAIALCFIPVPTPEELAVEEKKAADLVLESAAMDVQEEEETPLPPPPPSINSKSESVSTVAATSISEATDKAAGVVLNTSRTLESDAMDAQEEEETPRPPPLPSVESKSESVSTAAVTSISEATDKDKASLPPTRRSATPVPRQEVEKTMEVDSMKTEDHSKSVNSLPVKSTGAKDVDLHNISEPSVRPSPMKREYSIEEDVVMFMFGSAPGLFSIQEDDEEPVPKPSNETNTVTPPPPTNTPTVPANTSTPAAPSTSPAPAPEHAMDIEVKKESIAALVPIPSPPSNTSTPAAPSTSPMPHPAPEDAMDIEDNGKTIAGLISIPPLPSKVPTLPVPTTSSTPPSLTNNSTPSAPATTPTPPVPEDTMHVEKEVKSKAGPISLSENKGTRSTTQRPPSSIDVPLQTDNTPNVTPALPPVLNPIEKIIRFLSSASDQTALCGDKYARNLLRKTINTFKRGTGPGVAMMRILSRDYHTLLHLRRIYEMEEEERERVNDARVEIERKRKEEMDKKENEAELLLKQQQADIKQQFKRRRGRVNKTGNPSKAKKLKVEKPKTTTKKKSPVKPKTTTAVKTLPFKFEPMPPPVFPSTSSATSSSSSSRCNSCEGCTSINCGVCLSCLAMKHGKTGAGCLRRICTNRKSVSIVRRMPSDSLVPTIISDAPINVVEVVPAIISDAPMVVPAIISDTPIVAYPST